MSALIHYDIVDEKGNYTPEGLLIYVRNAFIKPKYRSLKYLREIIRKCAEKVDKPLVYFKRKKYKNRISPNYTLKQLKGVKRDE